MKKMRTTQLECIVFRRKDEAYEFLLMKRIPEKGGFWQPTTGGLEEEDSSLLNAALRELSEETGISGRDILRVIKDVHSFEISAHYLTGEPIHPIKEHVFGFEVRQDIEVSLEQNIYPEHDEFMWVPFEKAMEMLKWDNNKDALRKLHEFLTTCPTS